MKEKSLHNKSKYLSYLLRHNPEKENLKLDSQGYTEVKDILKALNICQKELDEIVETDLKKRYSYKNNKTLIRANQGHSVKNVNINFDKFCPTKELYHGTSKKYLESILKEGLLPQSRNMVHLSQDIETARNVGMRYSGKNMEEKQQNLVILKIDALKMLKDGFEFFISENNVIQIDKVLNILYNINIIKERYIGGI